MKNFTAIVLAAGKGTRMKSALPKVLHPVCGRPMLFYPLNTLQNVGVRNPTVVVGHDARKVSEGVKKHLPKGFSKPVFVLQKEQLGTGHAVMSALRGIKTLRRDTLILSGDVPLITEDTLKALFTLHRRPAKQRPVLSFISIILSNPTGYGRVVRDEKGRVARVVEQKDLSTRADKNISEVNAGIYLVNSKFLSKNLKKLKTKNAQNEYYLPDLIALARGRGEKVSALTIPFPYEVMGINNRIELSMAGSLMRERIAEELMLAGTTIIDPPATYIDYGVKIGRDTVIHPNVHLGGATVIGRDCAVEEGVKITDSTIGNNTHIKSHSIIESSTIGRSGVLGPFTRLRPGTTIHDNARVGNFVEIKNSSLGKNSKAGHLSYIGDTTVGKDVNIGAGTITCNYDGAKKYRTIIEDGVFVGSDSQLVAPVRVGRGAYIGSGSTITKNVPPGSLALSRPEQKVVKDWVKKRKKKK